ncbi:MAG TPA: nuclear transport factor 2 family protein, partial [Acidobacteriota bacterium]|nr:nuclear transport factor 2 family protein [Acidobacteriota bacterium]
MKTIASVLCFCILSAVSAGGGDAQLSTLQSRIARLEADVQGAEAIWAIKRLQYAYGHYAEFGLWHDLADLFAENGVGHYPAGDLGKEEIRKLFLQDVGKGKLGLADGMLYPHIMLQPVVILAPDRKTARGRWRVLAMLGSYGGDAIWAGGIYENEYVLENGAWKIKDLHYYSRYSGRYEQSGWTADGGAVPLPPDPAHAGAPIQDIANPLPPREKPQTLAALSRRLAGLTHRAQMLSDAADVENLQHAYGYYVDRKMWDDVADLFAADATMELGRQGVYAGKRSIRRALDQFGRQGLQEGEVNDRLQLQTIVDIAADGRSAKARGVELAMLGVNGVSAQWGEGIFENEFVKYNGVWQFRVMHFYPRLLTDYDKGWAKDAKPAPGPSKEFPPDRPPTSVYEIFPKFFVPPFHFPNPVTGRATRYPAETEPPVRRTSPEPIADRTPVAGTLAELSRRVAGTERLTRSAVAYDAAENLASAYGYYLDEFMWDETADLFARDGRRKFSTISDDDGRERIRESIKRRYPGKKSTDYFTVHQLIQPVIHVSIDGQTAKMRTRL